MSETLKKGYIDKKEKGSGEYQDLYLEGIDMLQRLSGATWTDYNEHDPGVTIFENLAYTLTNLSYKVDLPIIDILTESKQKKLDSGDNGFFIASEILTTNPIVKEDYRKLLVDGVHNVKNVWIRTHNQDRKTNCHSEFNIRGLYYIFVEMYDYDPNPEALSKEEGRVKNEMRALYHKHRNLCEDLYDVTILRPLNLDMELHLTIDVEADGEDVFAHIYYNINDFLTHEAKFESLWELRAKNEDFNDIYNGPTLKNGFISDRELQELKHSVYLSEITKIISKVDGVVSIDRFSIKDKDTDTDAYEFAILVPPHNSPRLEVPEDSSKLEFKTAEISLHPNAREIKKRLTSIEAEHYGSFKAVSKAINKAEIPDGESLGIKSYHSVREQFPAIYGIGKFGLPRKTSKKRKAQAKQLKGFLLPFDQLMTNFLAQLNSVYTLYDAKETRLQTYFYQVLEDMNNLEDPRKKKLKRKVRGNDHLAALVKLDHSKKEPIKGQWKETLKQLNDRYDTRAIQRLNLATDTLLARFAEDFPTYVLQKINTRCFGKNFTDESFDEKLLAWKRQLISNYGELSYNRSRSFNYTEEKDASKPERKKDDTPVIIKKIAMLLGIRHSELRNLSKIMEHTDFTTERIFESDTIILEEDRNLFKKIFITLRDQTRLRGENKANLLDIFRLGVVESNYKVIDKSDSKLPSEIILPGNVPIHIHSARSKGKIRKAIEHSVKLLKKLNQKTEGIHMIEHILLAPPASEKRFGFGFYLTTRRNKNAVNEEVSFEHTTLLSCEERNKNVDTIKDAIDGGTLVEFRKVGYAGHLRIEIYKNQNDLLAQSTRTFTTEQEVDAHINALNYLQDGHAIFKVEGLNMYAFFNGAKVNEAFFSFRMTFILPAWPVRFQEPSFKTQFNNILYQQVPIHLKYNSHWLDLDEMKYFEEKYFQWLQLLPHPAKKEERMAQAYDLIRAIQVFDTYGIEE